MVAGILQLLFPFFFLRREGFNFVFKIREAFHDSVLKRMLKLFLPRIWSSIVYQLNVFIDTIFASFSQVAGAGALAAINYANRLIQFPFALIALSIAPVIVVDFSKYHKENNLEDFKKLLVFSFQNIVFFVLPIMSIFILMPQAIIDVLFRRGEFGVQSVQITSSVLFYYAFGIFFFCSVRILMSSFYALKDTSTPAKTATITLLVNTALSAVLMFPLKIGGVALATSIASFLNFILLYRNLVAKIGSVDWADTKQQAVRVILLSLLIGLLGNFLWSNFTFNKYIKTAVVAGISLPVFIILGFCLGLKQLQYAKSWLLAKSN
jgi:putative peptidoglycan lipid II flippase